MARRQKNKPDAVVLVRFSALGDVAMTVPVVYDLCRSNPDLTVVMVTRKRLAALMVNAPSNLVVEGVDLNDYKGVRGMWRLTDYLRRKYRVLALIDLHDVIRTKLMRNFMRMRGVRVSVVDKQRRLKKQLVEQGARSFEANASQTLRTTAERYRDAIRRAGFEATEQFHSLFTNVGDTKTDGVFRIGIAPFAAHQGKIYPLGKMTEIVKTLAKQPYTEIYLFGAGDKEAETLDGMAAGNDNVHNMARRREGLDAELKLMSKLDVMVSMDSGNMHLAAIAGTPRIVSVWGATHPAAGFAPFGARPEDMLQSDLDCRPCSVYGNRPCRFGDWRCLNSISPQTVIGKINQIRQSL